MTGPASDDLITPGLPAKGSCANRTLRAVETCLPEGMLR